jgi:CRISPR-associated protein Cas1
MLFENNVQVAWLSPRGNRCRGRLTRTSDSAAALRLLQYQALVNPVVKSQIARQIIADKIESQITAARHYQRHGTSVREFLTRAGQRLAAVKLTLDLDVLRGLEGDSTKHWFALFAQLLKAPWQFPGRVRRPPTDPVNSLLSLGYTWLTNKTIARAEAAGLEIHVGALHEYRPGRPSLACDLVEPLRAPVVDRWVLSRLNQGHIRSSDFDEDVTHGVRLKRSRFMAVLTRWEQDWLARDTARLLDRHINTFIRRLREAAKTTDNLQHRTDTPAAEDA